jgi:hypothetical protein
MSPSSEDSLGSVDTGPVQWERTHLDGAGARESGRAGDGERGGKSEGGHLGGWWGKMGARGTVVMGSAPLRENGGILAADSPTAGTNFGKTLR